MTGESRCASGKLLSCKSGRSGARDRLLGGVKCGSEGSTPSKMEVDARLLGRPPKIHG